jgi:hypothetical protein
MVGGVDSFAGRHERGRPRDGTSIAVPASANHPIGFLVPSKQIFDSVAQHGTCQKQEGKVGNNITFQGVGRHQPEECWEEKKD